MSSTDESAEENTVGRAKDKVNHDKVIDNDSFMKHLMIERDFMVNDDGDIIQIRHLPVSKCTVALLRRICVKFKVSGYKNQNKARTLALLKNVVRREALKNNIYNDDLDSASTGSSKPSLKEGGQGVPSNDEDGEDEAIDTSDDDADDTSFRLASSNSAATFRTCRDNDDEGPTSDVHDGKMRGETAISAGETMVGGTVPSDVDNGKNVINESAGAITSASRARKNKKAKGTAPNAVTCMNTYFRVINVYMCQKNRSLVMDLGRPPNKANLDSRTSPYRHVYEALLTQYLDNDDNDAAVFAFPDHVYWTLTGIGKDVASSEFDSSLTVNDVEAILDYINYHYQVAHRKNKQSGSHADFENFVGTRYFLFYYHLWLNEAPNLLNFAVPELPSNAFRDTSGVGDNVSDVSSNTPAGRKRRKEQKKNCTTVVANETSIEMAVQKQFGDALVAFQSAQCEKSKSVREHAAPRRERDLLQVFSEYKDRLKATRLELNTAMNSATYDSDDSDVVNLKREIALCKRKRDEIFDLLSESDLK